MFDTMFRAVRLTESHAISSLMLFFIIIFLIYKMWMQKRLSKANNICREELSKIYPDFKILQEKNRETGLTIEQAVALLGKGNSIERGLAALGKKNSDEAIHLLTEAMREISDAFFYRAYAYYE